MSKRYDSPYTSIDVSEYDPHSVATFLKRLSIVLPLALSNSASFLLFISLFYPFFFYPFFFYPFFSVHAKPYSGSVVKALESAIIPTPHCDMLHAACEASECEDEAECSHPSQCSPILETSLSVLMALPLSSRVFLVHILGFLQKGKR